MDFVGLTSEKEFHEYFGNRIRMTLSGSFSIYDFIGNIYGCDGEQARLKFLELRRFGQVPARNIKPWINPRLDVPGQTSEDVLTQGFQ